MLQECLTSVYQRKFSMENFIKESALRMAKSTLKASLTEGFQYSNLLLGAGCSGSNKVALPHKKEQLSMKQRESVKPKESAKNAKKPRDQRQSRHSLRLRALCATDSLEQILA